MKKIKKILSLVLVLAMVLSSFSFAAADPVTVGEELKALGVLTGDENGNLNPDQELTREQAIVVLVRMMGKEAEAKATETMSSFKDVTSAFYGPYIAYAELQGWTKGEGAGVFGYGKAATTDMIMTFMVRALGYEADTLEAGVAKATELALNTDVTAEAGKAILRGQVFIVMNNTLNTPKKDGTKALVYELGLKDEPVVVVPAKVKSAIALNSKVVEVTLVDAVTTVDAAAFAVKAGTTAVEVASAKLAPYSTSGKVVLVTLATDLATGTLYTVTAGEASANFGGVAKDATKPTVTKVESTDYNEITVTFSEAVDATAVALTVAEKYGDKAALTVSFKEYASSSEVVYTTSDQKSSTLYGATIEGAVDFAGNTMTKDDAKTFVGQSKPTTKQGLDSITVVDSKTIVVVFDVKVDKATALDVANYTVTEKYGDKAAVAVTAAEMNLDADDNELPKEVKLTFATDTKAATLYNVAIKNIGTLYGAVLNTDDDEITFVGVAPDTAKPNGVTATSNSNTQITLSFTDANGNDNLDADVDVTLVTVAEKYGDKAALTLTKKEVKNNTIVFTTAAQKAATLYEVTVLAGIKDKMGNVSTDKLTTTFVGEGVATKISAIDTIVDTTGTDFKITVEFNKNHGEGALDVASYFIDGGIGYPTKVAKHATDADKVVLTVPKTTTGKLYKLTVKNVKNSDGVAMDAAGISKNFVGTGGAAVADPKLEAAVAINDQFMKLYFDTAVEDIAGIDQTNAGSIAAEITLTGAVGAATHAFIDPTNDKVLLVYTTTVNGFENNAGTTVTVALNNAGLDTDNLSVVMAESTTAPAKIAVDGIVAKDAKTLTVYFNQPIRHLATNFATITGANNPAISNVRALNDEMTQWEVGLSAEMTNTSYTLTLAAYDNTKISALASGATLIDLSTTLAYTYAGNASFTGYISNVYVVATDARTLVVYYPEAMNSTEAADDNNFTISGGGAPAVVKATYSSTNKTTTLILAADVNTATAKVVIANGAVNNAIGTKAVETQAGADLEVDFARNTTTPAKVAVKSVSNTAQVITVVFTQEFKTSADLDEANLTDLLTIVLGDAAHTVVDASLDTAATIVKKNGTNVVANSNTDFIDRIEITVDATADGGHTLVANAQGTVEFNNVVTVTGIKGQAADLDADAVIFVQK